jgi:hypothetical protein
MAKNLKFKTVAKDRLFYDRWQYCISFFLDEISCLKELDHNYITSILERRKEWREMSRQRLARHNNKPGMATIMGKRWREITEVTELNLHQFADQLLNATVPYKLITSVDQGWVYTNHIELIETLNADHELKYKQLSEAIVDRPKNSIRLKDSKYTHRSYFKITKLSVNEKNNIVNFFANQYDHIRLSPALTDWAAGELSRTQDYFFIDHVGDSWLVMMALIKPGLIRKTVAIIPA